MRSLFSRGRPDGPECLGAASEVRDRAPEARDRRETTRRVSTLILVGPARILARTPDARFPTTEHRPATPAILAGAAEDRPLSARAPPRATRAPRQTASAPSPAARARPGPGTSLSRCATDPRAAGRDRLPGVQCLRQAGKTLGRSMETRDRSTKTSDRTTTTLPRTTRIRGAFRAALLREGSSLLSRGEDPPPSGKCRVTSIPTLPPSETTSGERGRILPASRAALLRAGSSLRPRGEDPRRSGKSLLPLVTTPDRAARILPASWATLRREGSSLLSRGEDPRR